MYLRITCVLLFCGIFIALVAWATEKLNSCTEEYCTDESKINETSSQVLSRRKRFLIFPDGSSLQLVFCVQTAAVITIGDIFLYGNTAALAWNLPIDPKLILMLKEYERNGIRRSDAKNIYYVNEDGKIIARVPYSKPAIVNPAFAKRSVDEKLTFKERLKMKIDRTKMHERRSNRDFLKKDNMEHESVEFHRSSRLGLYDKLAKLITALGGDGRQCVLYKLCESARFSRQGTFLQELLRVVFTLPKGKEFEAEEHKDYDKAHAASDECASLYPGCDVKIPIQL